MMYAKFYRDVRQNRVWRERRSSSSLQDESVRLADRTGTRREVRAGLALRALLNPPPRWNVVIEAKILWGRSYFLSSIKICQRFMLSCFRIPRSSQGSLFIFSLTSFSSSALKIKREPPSSTKGPPIKIKPSATSLSINSACSSQKGCSRVPFDKSRFGPDEEITTNVFFIAGKPQASVHRVQPLRSRLRSRDELRRDRRRGKQRSAGSGRFTSSVCR